MSFFFFFFNDTATTEIYTLSLHDALPISIDRQKQVDTVFETHGIVTAGVPWIYYQDTKPTAKDLGPWWQYRPADARRSEEHTSELQSRLHLVCRLLLEKKKTIKTRQQKVH